MEEPRAKEVTRLRRGVAVIDAEIARVRQQRIEPVAERLAELQGLRCELEKYIEDVNNPQPLTPEEIESLRRGLEEMRQGKGIEASESVRMLREEYNLPEPKERQRFYHMGDFADRLNEALADE